MNERRQKAFDQCINALLSLPWLEFGAALVQQSPKDDKIIMEHVCEAHDIAKLALKSNLVGE